MEKTMQQRKNYYIDKDFQKKFIIKFCLLVIIGTIICGALIYSMSQGTLTTVFENSRLRIKSTADFILPTVLSSSIIVIILVGLAAIFVTLYTSHKIAGPLYRIATDLNKVIAGDLTVKFSLRRHDQLQAMADNMDKAIAAIKGDIAELKDMAANDKLQDIRKKLSKFKTE